MVEEEPLKVEYNGEVIPDLSKLKLGTLIASVKETSDWYDYSIYLTNTSRNELVNITINTNLPEELFQHNTPKQLGAKEGPIEVHFRLRASKLLKADLTGKPYIYFDYKEVKQY